MKPEASKPNPGSPEAQDQGCACPVLDNHYGRGMKGKDGEALFWINGECTIHGKGN
jgi:hypothetical protein